MTEKRKHIIVQERDHFYLKALAKKTGIKIERITEKMTTFIKEREEEFKKALFLN